ncbi:hypothetical protein BC830DRAFT_1113340 [Chytriomyces sp. MP71]|nr:hypothetical protein BC830DRAFT_1113340 [Chytriomyces sp. MP71]
MQAVHMWRNNTLKSAFHRWIDKERDRKLAKKRKAFNALYAFVLHPKAEALAMHRYTSLRHNFVSWFRAAYKRRSWKRRLELAVDIAVDFDRNRLTVAMFQLWKHRFVRNGLLQSASQKATKALDLSLKRRVFKLWFKKRRLNETSTQIYSRTILRGFFKAWKGRKRILLLYRKGDIHGTFLRNELVLLCFQLWKERT